MPDRFRIRFFVARVRIAVRRAAVDLSHEDTAVVAGGLTFYAAIAVVPLLLLTIRAAAFLISPDWVVRRFAEMALLLPDALGARAALSVLVDAGVALSPLGIVVAIFPATFYGEGLRRALTRYTPADEKFVGWRGRLLVLPFAILAPLLLMVLLVASNGLAAVTTGGGIALGALRVWLGFQCVWLVLAVPLFWVYRVIAPKRLRLRTAVVGALVTSSFVAGFVQGFVLFLAIPVDLGAPFGGLTPIGGGIALALWMFVLHVIVLIGWVVAYRYDDVSGTGGISGGGDVARP